MRWKQLHFIKLYRPGPGASDTALSRIIACQIKRDDGQPKVSKPFRWTKPKRELALMMHISEYSVEDITEMIHCTPDDLAEILPVPKDADANQTKF
jgi:hypothetical protein